MSFTALNFLMGTFGVVRSTEFGMLISITHLLSWLLLRMPLQALRQFTPAPHHVNDDASSE